MITPERIDPGKLSEYVNNNEIISAVFDDALEMVSIIDPVSLKPLYTNKSILIMLDYSQQQIENLGSDWPKKITHADDFPYLSIHITKYRKLLPGKRTRVVYRVQHANGDWRYLESVSAAIGFAKDSKKTKFILGITKDITKVDDNGLQKNDSNVEHRCQNCNRLLAVEKLVNEVVETKCSRCGEFNDITIKK
jgi:PAS domain-containing protein